MLVSFGGLDGREEVALTVSLLEHGAGVVDEVGARRNRRGYREA